jgi:SAM-dependent methyltransferase
MDQTLATAWLSRWEAQQDRCVPDRERRFQVTLEVLRARAGEAPLVLDLGGGPGSLARRVSDAIPGARVVAIDMDPVLLEIGRTSLADRERIRFLDSDLVDPALARQLGALTVDAAVSSTALHWLGHAGLEVLYQTLATVIRPGGLFLNADGHFGPGDALDVLCSEVAHQRPDHFDDASQTGESWDEWWAAATAAPELAEATAERSRRHWDHPESGKSPSLADHHALLRSAGFAVTGAVWQDLSSWVIAAIR